ncbi:hypothetical protein AKJ52_02005 [candidate division MSBL1 archaeon SCGC-AAA382C18]|uniref:DUF106 domain-containing protein n=1 Tax=candidate division MSBL1 archaeon SCGC-AAA382C18 TaxID=1698281 RepID=A0A133VJH0_9EURY|nr:hypothetical protein AKJ52_02005 [candidate division MSBL1 archaeon SCGC-AAA382C18]
MEKKYKIAFIAVASVLAIGLFASSTSASSSQEFTDDNYKQVLSDADQIIKRIRLDKEITENALNSWAERCEVAFPDVATNIRDLNPSEITVEEVKTIRKNIVDKGNSQGFELPFTHKYALFILLGISFSLAITVNTINRVMVDWDEMNRVREKQSELKDEISEARDEGDMKKANKLQQEQQEFMQENMGVMFSPIKSMIFIFIPFIIVFNIMSSMYSGWIVAWLPFKLPWIDIGFPLLNRFFKGDMAGLGFFGWYIMSYFGFTQIWRKILIPNR